MSQRHDLLEEKRDLLNKAATVHRTPNQFDAVFRGVVNVISTRRFFVRPDTVVFGANGFEAPIPFA